MSYDEEKTEEENEYYGSDYGEGFQEDFGAMSEEVYERAFDKAIAESKGEVIEAPLHELSEDDYEYDEVVGGRDKKPVMSLLNKGKLSQYEMDDLLNQLE